jgi:hypothetical protein
MSRDETKTRQVTPSRILEGHRNAAFRDLSDPVIGSLFEGKVIYDKTYGHVAYGCAICCGYTGQVLTFNPLGIPFGDGSQNGVQAQDSCGGNVVDVSNSFYNNWSTANHAVATVNASGYHTGVSVASTTTSTFGQLLKPAPQGGTCPTATRTAGGGDNVLKLSLSPSPLNMSTGDTNVTINLSISPTTVSLQPSFPATTRRAFVQSRHHDRHHRL